MCEQHTQYSAEIDRQIDDACLFAGDAQHFAALKSGGTLCSTGAQYTTGQGQRESTSWRKLTNLEQPQFSGTRSSSLLEAELSGKVLKYSAVCKLLRASCFLSF